MAARSAFGMQYQDIGREALDAARQALDQGDADLARRVALQALHDSRAHGDRQLEASLLLCLGHCDRLVSRFRRAHDACQQAAHLFRLLGDAEGETRALSTLSHVASCLGRNEEAVEVALLSERLGAVCPSPQHRAMLLNYLGVAYLWSRHFERAESTFIAAQDLAERSEPGISTFQPLSNRLWAEALSAVTERYRTGHLPALACMHDLADRCEGLLQAGQVQALTEGSRVTGFAIGYLGVALLRAWTGRFDEAAAALASAAHWVRLYRTTTWLEVFECWVRMELTWARGDLAQALAHCDTLTGVATRLEYEQLVCLGRLFESQLHEARGDCTRALSALRQLRQREQMIRVEGLASRARSVQWQLDFRGSESAVQRLEGMSRHLERLALEDSLTHLANRRCLEARLAERLGLPVSGERPATLVFIDVDRFKQVNDRFSHAVGDRVLQQIARLLSGHVRHGDCLARLAGDEFVALLDNTDETLARQVCARIVDAVGACDWSQLAAGLRVSISVGVAQALPGDTAAALLHRGDLAMYGHKRQRQEPAMSPSS